MESPDDIGGVFDIAGFLEGFKGNVLVIVIAIKRADDDKSGIGITLKRFEFVNDVVNTRLVGDKLFFVGRRNNLEIVETNDGGLIFIVAERFEQAE